jgi:nitrogen regulatory protein P-II 1
MSLSKIECIIKPFKLEEVKDALTKFGVSGLTVYEVKGFGRQRGHKEVYRGTEYKVDFIPKVKIELLIASDQVEEAVDVIVAAAKTGSIGDGKVSVTALQAVTRIRTGEKDLDAL